MKLEAIQDMISEGYIKMQKHPDLDLFICNYTQKAQFERVWNDITIQCRGIIMDAEGNICARPFPKFFNLGEMENQEIPNLPFEVYEKMDGSLGISYFVNGQAFVASRGSFISDQSVKANELLNTKYISAKAKMKPTITYLFEIIYPENRIVVDYGANEELVLLGMVETATGKELVLEDIGFPLVKKYDGLNDITQLKSLEEDNREGFVIKFKNQFRVKVKFDEYVRIHRIITNVSSISIWEYLLTGVPMEEIIEQVPDEFFTWVKETKVGLEKQFQEIEAIAKSEYKPLANRKETAMYFQRCKYPKVMFLMLDERDYSETIWRMIRPEFEKPFSEMTKGLI